MVKGMSKASLKSLSRSQLENIATAVFAKKSTSQGLTASEGIHRARSLMSGNTTSQLVNYIYKNTK